jgi:hypothetical protein
MAVLQNSCIRAADSWTAADLIRVVDEVRITPVPLKDAKTSQVSQAWEVS